MTAHIKTDLKSLYQCIVARSDAKVACVECTFIILDPAHPNTPGTGEHGGGEHVSAIVSIRNITPWNTARKVHEVNTAEIVLRS